MVVLLSHWNLHLLFSHIWKGGIPTHPPPKKTQQIQPIQPTQGHEHATTAPTGCCIDVLTFTSEQQVSESNEVSEKEWSKERSPSEWEADVTMMWRDVLWLVWWRVDRGHGRRCFRNFRVKWIKQVGLPSLFDLVFSETLLEAEFWENRCSWWLFWIGKDCYCSSAQKGWWS